MKRQEEPRKSLNLQECVRGAASGKLLQTGAPVAWVAIARGSSLELWTEPDDGSCGLELHSTATFEDSIAALTTAPLSTDEDSLFAIDTAGFWQLLRVTSTTRSDQFGLNIILEGQFEPLNSITQCSAAVFKGLFIEAARQHQSRSTIVGSLWADAITVLSIEPSPTRTAVAVQCAFNAEALAAGVDPAALSQSSSQAAISLAAAADGCLPTGRLDWRWGCSGAALAVLDLALLHPAIQQHSSTPVPLAVLYSDATASDARHSAAVHLTLMHVHISGSSDSVTLSNGGWSLRHLPADSCIAVAPTSSNSTQQQQQQLLVANSAGVLVCSSRGPLQSVQWPRACSPTAVVALPSRWYSVATAAFLIAGAEGTLYTAYVSSSSSSSSSSIKLTEVQLQLAESDTPTNESDMPHERQQQLQQLRAVRCLVPFGAHGLLLAACSSGHTALLQCAEHQQQHATVATLLQSPLADSVGVIADMAVLCDKSSSSSSCSSSGSNSAGRGLELAIACISGVDSWLRVLQCGHTMRITAQVCVTQCKHHVLSLVLLYCTLRMQRGCVRLERPQSHHLTQLNHKQVQQCAVT
jgi:hypothetical protein